jgi:hypothetical protein
MKGSNRINPRAGNISLFLAFAVVFILSAFAGAKEPAPTPFPGVSLSVQNSTIPPGGLFQFQLMLTEPKPIGNGSTRPHALSAAVGPVRGIALNDRVGVTAGVAVVSNSGIQVTTTSPLASFGTDPNTDYPILTMTFPVLPNAVVGSQFPIGIDPANTFFLDPSGQPYPQEIRDGRLTIGGTLSISDIIPGGGLQSAGTHIRVIGSGFNPESQVSMEGVALARGNFSFVSPTEMDVVLPVAVQLDGVRFRVRNKGGAVVNYFSYMRTQPVGTSLNALVAECYPLFSRQTYTSALLNWNHSGTTFTALALQNPGNVAGEATVEVLSGGNQVLGSTTIPLPAVSKITRDLAELFPQGANAAVAVRITSAQPIQVLGLLGDDATGNVVPVLAK